MRKLHLLALLFLLTLALAAGGCASKGKKSGPKPTGFSSADEKNIHEFMVRYPGVMMSGNVKAISHLYAEDAKIVPFIANVVRPIRAGEMSKRLPEIIADERKANLQIVWKEPMNIQVKGERASVQVVGYLAWQEQGKLHQAALNCFFGLVRDENYQWKIKESHGEPVGIGFTLTPQGHPKKPLPPREPRRNVAPGKGKPVKAQPKKQAAQPPAAQVPPAEGTAGQPDLQGSDGQPPQSQEQPQDGGQAPRPLF